MRHAGGLFVKCCLAAVVTLNVAFCSDDSSKPAPDLRHGYVHCGNEKNHPPVPVYEHPCNPKPVAELKCGEAVDVISREGSWLKIRSGDNTNRYISYYSVSPTKDYYLPIGLWATEATYKPNCKAFLAKLPTHRPVALYNPDPEYPEEGRRANVSGTVLLSLLLALTDWPMMSRSQSPLGTGSMSKLYARSKNGGLNQQQKMENRFQHESPSR